MGKKKKKKSGLPLTLALLAALAFAGYLGGRYLLDNKIPNVRLAEGKGAYDLYVYPGTEVEAVLDTLKTLVSRPGSLERSFRDKEVAKYMKPGHYTVQNGQTSVYLARMLNNGWQTEVNLTITGERLLGRLARKISGQMMMDSTEVAAGLKDSLLLARYGFTPSTVYALFMPDTYRIKWTAGFEEILDLQKKAYDAFWTEENDKKAGKLGLSRLEVSTLASIVKGESRAPQDFAKIAGVYINRLRMGMKLQACPTVAFLTGYTKSRILISDTRQESPYNTYLHFGLPPGPIAVPEKPYLEAVLNPDTKDGYIFFCADPSFNGLHRFARTLSEHNANGREYQQAFKARQAARKAAEQQGG